MNAQRLFRNEDLQLIEVPQKGLLELSNKLRTPLTAKIQGGHDDDLIEIEAALSLPNAAERKMALLRGQPAEPGQEVAFDGIEKFVGKEPALIVG